MRARFDLYTRRGCGLCDELLDELEALCHGRGALIELIDVDLDPGLRARYGDRVPVLECNGRELCSGRIDADRIRAILEG